MQYVVQQQHHTYELNRSIYFYEIFPTSPEPEFILRRSLDLSAVELESMSCLQAYGDKLAFATRGRVVIWDFIQHSVSFFPVDFPAAGPVGIT